MAPIWAVQGWMAPGSIVQSPLSSADVGAMWRGAAAHVLTLRAQPRGGGVEMGRRGGGAGGQTGGAARSVHRDGSRRVDQGYRGGGGAAGGGGGGQRGAGRGGAVLRHGAGVPARGGGGGEGSRRRLPLRLPLPLPQVDLAVPLALVAAGELAAAVSAGERLLARVRADVRGQVVAAAEAPHADAALEGLLARVHTHVACQLVGAGEATLTALGGAGVGPLAGGLLVLPAQGLLPGLDGFQLLLLAQAAGGGTLGQ